MECSRTLCLAKMPNSTFEHWSSMSSQNEEVWSQTQASPEFQQLKRKFRGFAFPLTVAFLAWYFLYILLTAFARDWIAQPVIGNINIAFVLGLLQFLSTFVIMWLYERHSTRSLDDASDALRDKVDKELAK
ncbi:MAG: hypothetical protein RLZZ576_797 [Actinomycetota bacterium]|jgi:uncharacterized membrane protein (DUF485 family)